MHSERRVRTLKTGRNQPCFCGSGKKYKKCHGSQPTEFRVHEEVKLAGEAENPNFVFSQLVRTLLAKIVSIIDEFQRFVEPFQMDADPEIKPLPGRSPVQLDLGLAALGSTAVNLHTPDDCQKAHKLMCRVVDLVSEEIRLVLRLIVEISQDKVERTPEEQHEFATPIWALIDERKKIKEQLEDELDRLEYGFESGEPQDACPFLALDSGDINLRICFGRLHKGELKIQQRPWQVQNCLTPKHRGCPYFPKEPREQAVTKNIVERLARKPGLKASTFFSGSYTPSFEYGYSTEANRNARYLATWYGKIMRTLHSIYYEECTFKLAPNVSPITMGAEVDELAELCQDIVARLDWLGQQLFVYSPRTTRIDSFEASVRDVINGKKDLWNKRLLALSSHDARLFEQVFAREQIIAPLWDDMLRASHELFWEPWPTPESPA